MSIFEVYQYLLVFNFEITPLYKKRYQICILFYTDFFLRQISLCKYYISCSKHVDAYHKYKIKLDQQLKSLILDLE